MKAKLLFICILFSCFYAEENNKKNYLFYKDDKTTFLNKNSATISTVYQSIIKMETDNKIGNKKLEYSLLVEAEHYKSYKLSDLSIAAEGTRLYTHKDKQYYFHDTPFMPIKPNKNGNFQIELYNVIFYPEQYTGTIYQQSVLDPSKNDLTQKHLQLKKSIYDDISGKMFNIASNINRIEEEIIKIKEENYFSCEWITGGNTLTASIGKYNCIEKPTEFNLQLEINDYQKSHDDARDQISNAVIRESNNCTNKCQDGDDACVSSCQLRVDEKAAPLKIKLASQLSYHKDRSRLKRVENKEIELNNLKSQTQYTVKLSDFKNPTETLAYGFNASEQEHHKVNITISDDFGINYEKDNVNQELGQILFIPDFAEINLLNYLRIPATEDCPVGKCLKINLKNKEGKEIKFIQDSYKFIPYSHGISEFIGTVTQQFDNGDHSVKASVNIDALRFLDDEGILEFCQHGGLIDLRTKLNFRSDKTVFESKDFIIENKFFIDLSKEHPKNSGTIRAIHDGGLQSVMASFKITENTPLDPSKNYMLCGSETNSRAIKNKKKSREEYTYNLNDILDNKRPITQFFYEDGTEIKNGNLKTAQKGNIKIKVTNRQGTCKNESNLTISLNPNPISPKSNAGRFDLCAGELPTVHFPDRDVKNNIRLYEEKIRDYTNVQEINSFKAELSGANQSEALKYPDLKKTLYAYQFNPSSKCFSTPLELSFDQHNDADIPADLFDNPMLCGAEINTKNSKIYQYDLSDFLKSLKNVNLEARDKDGKIIENNMLNTFETGAKTFNLRTVYGDCRKTREVVLHLNPSPERPKIFDDMHTLVRCTGETPTVEFADWKNPKYNVRVYEQEVFYLHPNQVNNNYRELKGTESERILTYSTNNDKLFAYLYDTEKSCFSKPVALKIREENEQNIPTSVWNNPLLCGDAEAGKHTYNLHDFIKNYEQKGDKTTFSLDDKEIKNGILTTDKIGNVKIRVRNTHGKCVNNRDVLVNLQGKPAVPTLLDNRHEVFLCSKENPIVEFSKWNGEHNLRVYDKKLTYLDQKELEDRSTELTVDSLPKTNIAYPNQQAKALFAYQYNDKNKCLSNSIALKVSDYKVPLDFKTSHSEVNPGDKPLIVLPKDFYKDFKNVTFLYHFTGRNKDGEIIEEKTMNENFFQQVFNLEGIYDVKLDLTYDKPNGAKCLLSEEKKEMVKVVLPPKEILPEPIQAVTKFKNGNVHVFVDKPLMDVYVLLTPTAAGSGEASLVYAGYHEFFQDWDHKITPQVPYLLAIFRGKKIDHDKLIYKKKILNYGGYTQEFKAQHNIDPNFKDEIDLMREGK